MRGNVPVKIHNDLENQIIQVWFLLTIQVCQTENFLNVKTFITEQKSYAKEFTT